MSRTHFTLLRRRRQGKTDYRRRLKVVSGKLPFASVTISGKNVTLQIIEARLKGDLTRVSTHSRELRKLGWKGSMKSLPSSYLVGLVGGNKAQQAGVKKVIVRPQIRGFVRGSRFAAVVKGIRDSGVEVPFSEEGFPSEERLKGIHIAEHAKGLAETDKASYTSRFSQVIKRGLKPEEYPNHFELVKKAILKPGRGKKRVRTSKKKT